MNRSRIEPSSGQEESVWDYPRPPRFEETRKRIKAVFCWVDGEKVEAQPGDFYGGWITSEIVGPFNWAPGTWGW